MFSVPSASLLFSSPDLRRILKSGTSTFKLPLLHCQGANLIPLNILPTNVTARDLRRLLDDAVAANMNMVGLLLLWANN